DLAWNDDQRRTLLAGVGIRHRLVDRLVGGGVGLLRGISASGRRRVAIRRLRRHERRGSKENRPEKILCADDGSTMFHGECFPFDVESIARRSSLLRRGSLRSGRAGLAAIIRVERGRYLLCILVH